VVTGALVIGDAAVVSDAVMSQLPAPTRLGGADAYGTSRAVLSESRRRGVPDNIVYTTDGKSAMETSLLGSAVGRIGGLGLMSPGGSQTALRTIAQSKTLREVVTGVVAVEK